MSRRRKPNRGRPGMPTFNLDAAVSQVALATGCELDVAAAAVRQAVRILPTTTTSTPTDPRTVEAGPQVGDHDPTGYGHHDHLVDVTRAVLIDHLAAEVVHLGTVGHGERDAFGLTLGGRINTTTDRSRVVYLGDVDMLAALVVECIGVAERSGHGDDLEAAVAARSNGGTG